MLSINVLAWNVVPQLQDNRTRNTQQKQAEEEDKTKDGKAEDKDKPAAKKLDITAQPTLQLDEDTIPDSLINSRWKVQRTVPITHDDLRKGVADLAWPESMKPETEYDDTLNTYFVGSKMGDSFLSTPIAMTPEEYLKDRKSVV